MMLTIFMVRVEYALTPNTKAAHWAKAVSVIITMSAPRTIIFFGPPGTGKTHFARAIAARLQWWYIEVSPSDLLTEGEDCMGHKLKSLFKKTPDLEEAVIFIDEFEEIAGKRDNASRTDKSITNEFLKQVPLFRREKRNNLLVCATNYIRELDAALIRA